MLDLRSLLAMTAIAGLVSIPVLAQQPGVVATTNNPNLAVASVKLESGVRLGKIIGGAVTLDGGSDKIGTIDDLVMTDGDKVTVAIVSTGGVLGLGSKLVAVPFNQLKREADRIVLTGVTKDSLAAMPSFVY